MKISLCVVRYRIIYYLLVNILVLNSSAQKNKTIRPFEDCFYENNEKVFVHLPEYVYVSGEILNYKTYIVNASSLLPESPSKVLYFDIVDHTNKQIMNWRANTAGNMVAGSIQLPDSISGGIYRLRAYTNWMKNFSPDLFFSTRILITKITDKNLNNLNIPVTADIKNRDIEFFPEGGNLVEGISSKVAYRFNAQYSGTEPVSGCIKDENQTVIDSIFNVNENFGTFTIIPEPGKKYNAEFMVQNGEKISADLPQIKKSGYILRIDEDQGANMIITIRSNTVEDGNFKLLHLIISSHGVMFRDTNIILQNGVGRLSVPKVSLANGISEAVLFNPSGLPLAKRLFYVSHYNPVSVQILNQNKSYQKRQKVHFEIEIENLLSDETADLSISVSDVRSGIQNLSVNNDIGWYLYFNSELSQFNSSFIGTDPLSSGQINDRLITISPENYAWDYAPGNSLRNCRYISENKGFILAGNIYYKDSGTPVSKGLITLAVADSIYKVDYCYSDTVGNFYFSLNRNYDNRDLILQYENLTSINDKVVWVLDNKNEYKGNTVSFPCQLSQDTEDYLAFCRNVSLISRIYKNGSSGSEIQSESGLVPQKKGSFPGDPDYILYPSDYVELENFKEIADNLLPGVTFKKKNNEYTLQLHNTEVFESEGSFFLNGVPFYDDRYIASLGSKDIRYIEVITSKYFLGDITYFGIVSIYTYDGKIPSSYLKNGACLYKNEVMNSNQYNAQNYSAPSAEKNKKIPDYRQTLYWNPDVQLTGNKKFTLEFNTSDLESVYYVNVQGITENGIPLHGSISFEVTK